MSIRAKPVRFYPIFQTTTALKMNAVAAIPGAGSPHLFAALNRSSGVQGCDLVFAVTQA